MEPSAVLNSLKDMKNYNRIGLDEQQSAKLAELSICLLFMIYFPFAASKVFCISETTVMGPTPPGTGVMNSHFGATLSK